MRQLGSNTRIGLQDFINDLPDDKKLIMIEIYTDGSCINTCGGAGFIAINGEQVICDGFVSFKETTNNRMELSAIICAFELICDNNWDNCIIHTDSEYCQKGYTTWMDSWVKKSWKKADGKVVLNQDLWEILYNYKKKYSNVKLVWVKAHNGNIWNEHVDKLAKKAATNLKN